MKKAMLLCAMLLGLANHACAERDAFADRIRRAGARSRGSVKKATGGGAVTPSNVLEDAYTWTTWWGGEDATASNWANGDGGTAVVLAVDATASPTLDQSTTGLEADAIGAARVDQAVTFAAGDAYEQPSAGSGTFPGLADNVGWHVRMVVRFDTAITNGRYVYYYQTTGSPASQLYMQLSSSNRMAFNFKSGTSLYTMNSAVNALTAGQWHLIDFIAHDDNDVTPYGEIMVNGSVSTGADGVEDYQALPANGRIHIGEVSTDNSATMTLLWVGIRPGTISEAEHDADCVSLGLCSP